MLYECETWLLALREVRRLREFENRIMRRIFGPKKDANWKWRRFHKEEIHSLYLSPNIVSGMKSRRLRLAGYVVRMEEVLVLSNFNRYTFRKKAFRKA